MMNELAFICGILIIFGVWATWAIWRIRKNGQLKEEYKKKER